MTRARPFRQDDIPQVAELTWRFLCGSREFTAHCTGILSSAFLAWTLRRFLIFPPSSTRITAEQLLVSGV